MSKNLLEEAAAKDISYLGGINPWLLLETIWYCCTRNKTSISFQMKTFLGRSVNSNNGQQHTPDTHAHTRQQDNNFMKWVLITTAG